MAGQRTNPLGFGEGLVAEGEGTWSARRHPEHRDTHQQTRPATTAVQVTQQELRRLVCMASSRLQQHAQATYAARKMRFRPRQTAATSPRNISDYRGDAWGQHLVPGQVRKAPCPGALSSRSGCERRSRDCTWSVTHPLLLPFLPPPTVEVLALSTRGLAPGLGGGCGGGCEGEGAGLRLVA